MKASTIPVIAILLAVGAVGGVVLDRLLIGRTPMPGLPEAPAALATSTTPKEAAALGINKAASKDDSKKPKEAAKEEKKAPPTPEQIVEAEVSDAIEKADYAKAFERIATIPNTSTRNAAYRRVYKAWTRRDAKTAAASAAAIEDNGLRENALRAVGEEWAMLDPTTAFSWLAEMPVGAIQRSVMQGMVSTLI